jgi:hypothetical protein
VKVVVEVFFDRLLFHFFSRLATAIWIMTKNSLTDVKVRGTARFEQRRVQPIRRGFTADGRPHFWITSRSDETIESGEQN